jgi:hypothetical protein
MGMRTPSWSHTTRIIVFSLLIGGVSGVLGTAVTYNYLSNYTYQLNQLTEPLRLTQERPRALPESYEEALTRLEERALPAVGAAYDTTIQSDEGYAREQAEATVISLTSDGWILGRDLSLRDLVVIGTKECEVDQIVEDERTGMQFAHCPTSSLAVVDFGQGHQLLAGDQVFIAHGTDALTAARVKQVSWGDDIVRSSDTPLRHLLLDTLTTSDMVGAPVFSIFGELVGIMGGNVEGEIAVIPFEVFAGGVEQVLVGNEEITYPALGVNAIDLANMVGMSEELTQGSQVGALLHGDVAVETGSSAQEAGLQEGDIILSIDGVSVNSENALADLVLLYQEGDTVSIELQRNGERADVQVTLGALSL